MEDLFTIISLSFDDPATVDVQALSQEMQALGLSQGLISTEGQPVTLPEFSFAGTIPSGVRMEVHQRLHRGLNAALKRLNHHGRFFILVSPDVDWSCCCF